MAGREVAVKKYVVRLSAEERERLEDLRSKGTIPARRLLKVQILLKADVSEAGEGWSDSKIMKAFDTTDTMVYTVCKKLVEEGLDGVLSRKRRETPPVARIFDGEREAKLIALACSDPPPGFARWTLRLLEEKVVELQIVDRASDSTIGRVLKRMARPVCKGICRAWRLISLLQRIRYPASKVLPPGQDGDTRAPVLIKSPATDAVF